ncbi:MAG: 4-alpha-glucanotransferase [Bacteroidetes bacterium]|nr:4-alpha-glucanotransferase [Bacteroidota bacterium]
MDYNSLLNTYSSSLWKKIGVQKRAGVALPLFSVYSKNSIGTGEIPDLKKVIDWCRVTGMSVIQLLPLNELGSDNAPYNAISTFGIEPMYISIKKLRNADLKPFRKEIRALKKNFPAGGSKVNYNIRTEKLLLLKKIFSASVITGLADFETFKKNNFHWLKYYCLFKIISGMNSGKNWSEWDLKYRYIASYTAEKILKDNENEINFYIWVQWQLYEQLISVKKYAKRKKVFIMGDIPFLVSRNSADVWAYKNYFKLQLSSGAPPDMYFSKGQRWGMPPYNWDNISADNYSYFREKIKYAENFFDMYRIDHFVGLFRIWTIDLRTPEESGGMDGKFDPEDERYWEGQGRNILRTMINSSEMLPCAEDLGTVPYCSDKVLKESGVTGINVQRWEKDPDDDFNFISPADYRINSVATVSTHDSSSLPAWWENEAGTVDEISFRQICEKFISSPDKYSEIKDKLFDKELSGNGRLYWKEEVTDKAKLLHILGLDYETGREFLEMYISSFNEKKKFLNYIGMEGDSEHNVSVHFIRSSLEKISSSSSVFSIQLLMEYLYLDPGLLEKFRGWEYRINFPGTVKSDNWSVIFPVSLEELIEFGINGEIREINMKYGRI